MKLLLLLVIVAAVYALFFRHPSTSTSGESPAVNGGSPVAVQATAATPAGSNYFKRPLDRTHEVIDQVQKQRREDKY